MVLLTAWLLLVAAAPIEVKVWPAVALLTGALSDG